MKTKVRCSWCENGDAAYLAYHDEEWGVPCHNDHKHFEFMILEMAQAGLSWLTILRRREGYRRAFANFDPAKVARYDADKIEQLMLDEGIIRNRKKIVAAVHNAKLFLQIQKDYGSFDAYIWQFVNGKTIQNSWSALSQVPCLSAESTALSNDLRKKGFQFVGPKIVYSHMQALGLVNDHVVHCYRYQEVQI